MITQPGLEQKMSTVWDYSDQQLLDITKFITHGGSWFVKIILTFTIKDIMMSESGLEPENSSVWD